MAGPADYFAIGVAAGGLSVMFVAIVWHTLRGPRE
jgi:hypothetical protein